MADAPQNKMAQSASQAQPWQRILSLIRLHQDPQGKANSARAALNKWGEDQTKAAWSRVYKLDPSLPEDLNEFLAKYPSAPAEK